MMNSIGSTVKLLFLLGKRSMNRSKLPYLAPPPASSINIRPKELVQRLSAMAVGFPTLSYEFNWVHRQPIVFVGQTLYITA